jgi:hypothetical protein
MGTFHLSHLLILLFPSVRKCDKQNVPMSHHPCHTLREFYLDVLGDAVLVVLYGKAQCAVGGA